MKFPVVGIGVPEVYGTDSVLDSAWEVVDVGWDVVVFFAAVEDRFGYAEWNFDAEVVVDAKEQEDGLLEFHDVECFEECFGPLRCGGAEVKPLVISSEAFHILHIQHILVKLSPFEHLFRFVHSVEVVEVVWDILKRSLLLGV